MSDPSLCCDECGKPEAHPISDQHLCAECIHLRGSCCPEFEQETASTATPAKGDICGRPDLIRMVDSFYQRVGQDPVLGPIFNEIAQVDWNTHLPKMYDFWDTVLFRAGTFRGNPLVAHAKLVSHADMSRATFDRWLTLFTETVNELFEGSNAVLILRSAEDMANVIYSKINGVPDPRFDPANLTPEQRARYAKYREPG